MITIKMIGTRTPVEGDNSFFRASHSTETHTRPVTRPDRLNKGYSLGLVSQRLCFTAILATQSNGTGEIGLVTPLDCEQTS